MILTKEQIEQWIKDCDAATEAGIMGPCIGQAYLKPLLESYLRLAKIEGAWDEEVKELDRQVRLYESGVSPYEKVLLILKYRNQVIADLRAKLEEAKELLSWVPHILMMEEPELPEDYRVRLDEALKGSEHVKEQSEGD